MKKFSSSRFFLIAFMLFTTLSISVVAQEFSSMRQTMGYYKANNSSQSGNTESTIIRWDNATNLDAIGLTGGGTFAVAGRFTPAELGPLAGQGVISVEVYINDLPSSMRLVLWGPNTDLIAGPEVYSQTFTPTATSWNTITLTTPYVIDGTTDLWIGYEVTHTTGTYPAGVDPGPAVFNGDRIYNGGAWNRLSVLAPTLNYNWNIAATVDVVGPPCPVDPATNPSPINGATNISALAPGNATWTNGAGTTQVEVFFGPQGNAVSVYSGSPITSIAIPSPLEYATTYEWRVLCKNDTCSGAPVAQWLFTTEQNPNLFSIFFDDFEASTDTVPVNFTITNDGGTLVWRVFGPTYPNAYTMPATSSGKVLAADADEGGSGTGPTTLLSTATLTNPLNCSNYSSVTLQFDSDWNAIDEADSCYVDVSNDGTTWVNYLAYGGVDVTSTTVTLDISATADGQSQVWIRFKSVQPGWDWWWVVDNILVEGVTPVELGSFTAASNGNNVVLNWSTATETNNQGFEIQRKTGNDFIVVGFVEGYGTTTETKTYRYTDAGVSVGTQVYRLKQIDFNGAFEYSSEVEVEIGNPSVFALDQNYPNPFNPSTRISYSLAADAKVTLKVFDVLGQEVMTLVNNTINAGSHEVTFDASNLNSGVYFYTIEANGLNGQKFTSTKKMILTK